MNKQEVIDEIKRIHANAVGRSQVSPHPLYADGVADTCSDVIKLLDQVDESQKIKVALGENQQIVFEWLKKKYKTTDIEPIELFWRLRANSNSSKWRLQPPYKNYRYLTEKAQCQVLAAFAEWSLTELD